LAILVAYLAPSFGSKSGPLHPAITNLVLIGIVFFVIGLGLDFEKLKAAVLNWKSHVCIQITIFVIFPLLMYVTGEGRDKGERREGGGRGQGAAT
jgi:sodium/bile acid cotransporter 7